MCAVPEKANAGRGAEFAFRKASQGTRLCLSEMNSVSIYLLYLKGSSTSFPYKSEECSFLDQSTYYTKYSPYRRREMSAIQPVLWKSRQDLQQDCFNTSCFRRELSVYVDSFVCSRILKLACARSLGFLTRCHFQLETMCCFSSSGDMVQSAAK